jgi:hypothetical protein
LKQQIVDRLDANIGSTLIILEELQQTLYTMRLLADDIVSLDDFDNDDYNSLLSILNFQDETIRDLGKIQNQLFFVLVGDLFTRCKSTTKPRPNVVKLIKDEQ